MPSLIAAVGDLKRTVTQSCLLGDALADATVGARSAKGVEPDSQVAIIVPAIASRQTRRW